MAARKRYSLAVDRMSYDKLFDGLDARLRRLHGGHYAGLRGGRDRLRDIEESISMVHELRLRGIQLVLMPDGDARTSPLADPEQPFDALARRRSELRSRDAAWFEDVARGAGGELPGPE